MSLMHDLIIDRNKLKKKVSFWQVIALVAFALLIYIIPTPYKEKPSTQPLLKKFDHIASFSIDGVIEMDNGRQKILEQILANDDIKAVIMYINSPGGGAVASEILYYSLKEIAEKKPLVAVMTETAASGGYMIALAADYIFARYGTMSGSIGVLAIVLIFIRYLLPFF